MHGAGQCDEAFAHYIHTLGDNRSPRLFMAYMGLKGDITQRLEYFWNYHTRYPDLDLIPQIGLSMTKDGTPDLHYEHEVAAGLYDSQIELLANGLRAYGKPVFLRIGYEFNGHWNGYAAETYLAAWRRVVNKLRSAGADNVATVWCFACDGTDQDFMKFYPGDDWVDWWGIDLFSAHHLTAPSAYAFLESATSHRKPVMIGESSARRVGVLEGEVSWLRWFEPFFSLIRKFPCIKAFCYINWDWSKYPQWHDWGDCRLEQNTSVAELYRREMDLTLYEHAHRKS
ncbi:MAG: hypothetical protein LR015_03185 [Verrucomicrobia bacterium]|nr:hypothetical protein [Verrucomicrobiota bacterium]